MPPDRHTNNCLKHFDNHDDLPPSKFDAEGGSRAIYHGSSCSLTPPPSYDVSAYECYLRDKWKCSDIMPEGFDPDKLEKKRRALLRSRGDGGVPDVGREPQHLQEEASNGMGDESVVYPPGVLYVPSPPCRNHSVASVVSTTTEPLDTDEEPEDYESDGIINETRIERLPSARRRSNAVSGSSATSAVADPVERQPTPRIKAGSKPPLSKSAYANCCASSIDCNCDARGRRARSGSVSRPRAPRYFPFRSQISGKK